METSLDAHLIPNAITHGVNCDFLLDMIGYTKLDRIGIIMLD
jgi:hypothetical protein